jgi:putative endonuclease
MERNKALADLPRTTFMYYVYLLKSEKNNRIYIGSTNNLKKRIKEHNKGKVFSTKYYLPWRLIYYEAYDKESLARLREKRLKYNGNALRELKKRLNLLPLKSGAGFTLTEILVVLFIISLLSALTFANYRQGGKQMALQRAASKLAQDIRRAQEMAIGAKEFGGSVPRGGYGIQLKSHPAEWLEYYVLFADCNENSQYDASGSAPDCASATPANPYPELVEKIYFEKGITLQQVIPDPVRIIFVPPDPTVVINPAAATSSVTIKNDGQTKVITINSAGLIEIQ